MPTPTHLTSPAIDVSGVYELPNLSKHRVFLFSKYRRLLLFQREVIVVNGPIIDRRLIYDEDIVSAAYTSFQHGVADNVEVLAVCLKRSAHIYLPGGDSHIVSFPFTLKAAFPFDSGLLLERDTDQVLGQGPHSAYRFFTLVDPIGDIRVVTTSSTSVVAGGETLVYFPKRVLGKAYSLCMTFNSRNRTVNVYHMKSSTRNTVVNSSLARKKRHMSAMTPNPSRILEDELYESMQPQNSLTFPNSTFSNNLSSASVNMEKKRTSTLLSGVSSIARMGSEPVFEQGKSNSNHNSIELSSLKRDMIWTKVDTFVAKAKRSHLTLSALVYEDKEVVVVSNRASNETDIHVYRVSASNMPSLETSFKIPCQHAMALDHEAFKGWLLLLLDSQSIQLIHPILDIMSPAINFPESFPSIASIASTVGCHVVLRSATEARTPKYIKLVLEPRNQLVLKCLRAWKYLSGSKINETVWVLWRSALMLDEMRDDWRAFVTALLSLIYDFGANENSSDAEVSKDTESPGDTEPSGNEITSLLSLARILHDSFKIDYSLQDLLPYIVILLHLLYEETKLDILARHELDKLGTLLTQITLWVGWSESWTSYYMIDQKDMDHSVKMLSTSLVYSPPSIFDHLISLCEGKRSSFLRISQLVEESDEVNRVLTPRTSMVCDIFQLLSTPKIAPSVVVKELEKLGVTSSMLQTFPLGVRIPIKNCLSSCQNNPEFEWNGSTLNLVGRRDLAMLLSPRVMSTYGSAGQTGAAHNIGRDANAIVNTTFDNDSSLAWDEQSEADRYKITKLNFDTDRRFFEITTLLHQTRIQTANLETHEDISEYDSTLLKRQMASLVALRTLTIPLGRAALFYGGRIPLLTEKFPIPKFNLDTLIAPSMTTIVLTESSFKKKIMDWGHFHNGVSSGLSISPQARGISGSWVIFNKPAENNAQHAGFLLGLGLNGHLKSLEEWHIYNYLGPKHPLTSVGLLIGMAASMKGSMENKLTKVLSVHAVALLPQGANDLNVPTIVQSAGLIGIGLLYLETQHRRMSEILLSQFGNNQSEIDNDDEQESYRLAAGIALGLINLGKGDDLGGLNDTHVVDKLLDYAIYMKDTHSEYGSDKASSGALIALGFIYMRTKNTAIAAKLQIPNSEQLLDYVRPDLLLLRCVSRNLILWDNVEPTHRWIEHQIPHVLRKRHDINNLSFLDSDQIAMFNVLGGACLSVAIKYASKHDPEARDILLYYLDIAMQLTTMQSESYDQKIALSSAFQLQNILALCSAVVMAGSGDIEVLRRLRILHGRTNKSFGYGAHMASSMALGILFLGGSQCGFGDSNFAIAALVVSLYPVFPNEDSEIEVHLQVLRHFWSLSVEPKCLVVRDVKDGSPIKVPVTIRFKDGTSQTLNSPVYLAEMPKISAIEIDSKNFFKVSIDFLVNSEYLEQFKKRLTIYVLRKSNYELLKSSVSSLIESHGPDSQKFFGQTPSSKIIQEFSSLKLMQDISSFEKDVYLREFGADLKTLIPGKSDSGLSVFDIIDEKIELSQQAKTPKRIEHVLNLKLIFAYTDSKLNDEHYYLDARFIETLKRDLWELTHTI